VAEMVFKEEMGEFDTFKYLEGAGNDEVVFESPGIEVPFVSVMLARSNGKLYRQYHTHLDNLDMVDEAQLEEAARVLAKMTDVLENDFYVTRRFNGYLCLSNPEIDLYSNKALKSQLRSFLNGGFRYFDGSFRISEIAAKHNIKFDLVLDFVKKMEKKGLVSLSHETK
jgi:aminopeptidase-like protein